MTSTECKTSKFGIVKHPVTPENVKHLEGVLQKSSQDFVYINYFSFIF